ncbi:MULTISPECIES: nitric oxide synthase oxygenase [Actinoalloteichus]|uniref:Nitric oxide synthase, oxygenase domain n=1 Tax=Actinoalloteichus fjordicus TaxID=1612552 RepID=A0AAC9LEN3_9PSEU|nr:MULTISPECIES: nitric oxide synthase oxygenase [Actinoalloteichus]APU16276.1 nitric oxide synthase, oxygenase domain [Actinoalloteichus fjordicus]APU22336.1 nitric oxide synthase, oxygenase domain [Actinoalloteichus sp. GBA129-24]
MTLSPGRVSSGEGCPVADPQVWHQQPAPQRPEQPDVLAQAEEFLDLFEKEHDMAGALQSRRRWIRAEIEATGTYVHTTAELVFGARVAWRNSARCIGRLYWKSLRVRDFRAVRGSAAVAERCVDHLRSATNNGRVRPTISVFAADAPDRPGPRIWNEQLIRYAGYRTEDGGVLGDPRYLDFTEAVQALGWQPPAQPGAFDVLPLVIDSPEEGTRWFELPRSVVHEVELRHPELPWFAELGLRWHTVPAISNMSLVIGGVSYSAAPFNGWYMGTEIGARNLADHDRYAMLPEVARRMGLDTSSEQTLWKDRALVELNRAVLHSFAKAEATITDHHTESERFLTHVSREEKAGRSCPADWSWIVPPLSGSLTPVFHRYYDTEELWPNFVLDDEAAKRGTQGGPVRAPMPAELPEAGLLSMFGLPLVVN